VNRQQGVTLLELMIVVAVVGTLAAIAYPSYRAQVMRSHRTDAKIGMERIAQTMERCYTNSAPKTYVGCVASPVNTDNGHYTIVIAPTATDFTLTATAIAGQVADKDCRTFTLDSANARGARTAANADNTANCWPR
jgi:type IV pilus assembly protein PilE